MLRLSIAATFLIVFAFAVPSPGADDYGAILSRARTEGKPVILFFFSKGCPYCDLMESETFRDGQTMSSLNETALLVKIDGDRRRDLSRLYLVRGYPTTWLIDEKGSRIDQIPGYISRKDFRAVLAYLKGKHYRSMGIKEYLAKRP